MKPSHFLSKLSFLSILKVLDVSVYGKIAHSLDDPRDKVRLHNRKHKQNTKGLLGLAFCKRRTTTLEPSSMNSLVGPSSKALRDIADVGVSSTLTITEVIRVDAAGVVLSKGRVDGFGSPLVSPVLQVGLVMLSSPVNHRADLVLAQPVSVWVSIATRALHDPSSRDALGTVGSLHTNVAMAFLHDNTQDDTLIHPNVRRRIPDADVDPANVVPGATRLVHVVLVDSELI